MKNNKNKNSNRPVYAKRIGNIRVTVWENRNEEQIYFNASVVRRYRDGDEWKETSNLNGLGDITAALFALQSAARFISDREDAHAQETESNEEA